MSALRSQFHFVYTATTEAIHSCHPSVRSRTTQIAHLTLRSFRCLCCSRKEARFSEGFFAQQLGDALKVSARGCRIQAPKAYRPCAYSRSHPQNIREGNQQECNLENEHLARFMISSFERVWSCWRAFGEGMKINYYLQTSHTPKITDTEC